MRPNDFVRNRSAGHRDANHVAARPVNGFADGFGHFVRLASRETDATLSISHRNERVEREAASALHDLCDTVDRDHVLNELASTISASAVTVTAFAFAASTPAAA
jgi:hypothetical protein